LVAEDLGVKPEKCLVFEDVPMGILAGKNAGMKVCAIEDDFTRPQRDRKRELADFYINDFDDIMKETYEVL
jgi:beta-phosphoglucomutase-like phosphatase (HAD superfamily)